jgi:hypothetical protein
MTQRVLQSNFLAGQLTKTFRMRRDDKRYYQGAELIKNGIPLPTGGVTRRPPFSFIANATNLDFGSGFANHSYLATIPWQSSPTKSYVIVITGYLTQVHFSFYKRTSGVTTLVHKFVTSYTTLAQSDWRALSYSQSRDTMYIAIGGTEKVKKLVNTGGDTSWTFSDVQEIDGPFDTLNLNVNFKMDPSAQSGNIDISATNKASGSHKYYFTSADIGKLIRIRHNHDPDNQPANYWGCAVITGLKSGTNNGPGGTSFYHTVTATVQTFATDNELSFGVESGTNPAGTVNWRLGAFSPTDGYPNKVSLHQNRLLYARQNRIMASRANDLERHSPTLPDEANNHSVTPDSAVDVKFLDLRAETINWMYSDQVLHIGTNTGRYVVPSVTPQDFSVVKQSNVGVANINPVFIDNLIYVRYDKQALLTADFNFRRDRFEDKSLNLNNDQILKPKITRLATTNYPFNIIWVALEDGTLASLTYDMEQEVLAWASHSIEECLIEDIVSLKTSGDIEVLYAIVRNSNASAFSARYLVELSVENIEYLQTSDYPVDKLLDLYINLSDTAAIASQTQFRDINIMAVKDGVNYPQTGTVNSSGNFTLASSISGNFHVGIPIDFRIETLPLALPQTSDTGVSQRKDIRSVDLGLYRTGSCKVQIKDSSYSEAIEFRKDSDDVDKVPPFRDKLYNVPLDGDTDRELSLIITQETQAPITILGLNYNVEVEGMQ